MPTCVSVGHKSAPTILSEWSIAQAHHAIGWRVNSTRSGICDKTKLQGGECCTFVLRDINLWYRAYFFKRTATTTMLTTQPIMIFLVWKGLPWHYTIYTVVTFTKYRLKSSALVFLTYLASNCSDAPLYEAVMVSLWSSYPRILKWARRCFHTLSRWRKCILTWRKFSTSCASLCNWCSFTQLLDDSALE